MVEHLYQNARSIRKRYGTCQTRRLRKTPRQIGMGGRSAVAQGAARHQTARNHDLKLHRHDQQQQCRHQQHTRHIARRIDCLGTTIVQERTHKIANHARADDDALVDNNLVRWHKLGHACVKEVLAGQKREKEKRQAQNLPYAPAQICGCVSQVPHGNPHPLRCPENHFNGERVLVSTQCPNCYASGVNAPTAVAVK